MKEKPNTTCSPKDPCHSTLVCDKDGEVIFSSCASGQGDCGDCVVAEADISVFHDSNLSKATKKIRKILADIPPDSRGRKLSFISTSMGFLIAWVEHGAVVPEGAEVITQKSVGEKAFAKKLKIKGS